MECGEVKNAQSRWEDVAKYFGKNFPMVSHGYCSECFEKALSDLDRN
jgi:hypothetical protein